MSYIAPDLSTWTPPASEVKESTNTLSDAGGAGDDNKKDINPAVTTGDDSGQSPSENGPVTVGDEKKNDGALVTGDGESAAASGAGDQPPPEGVSSSASATESPADQAVEKSEDASGRSSKRRGNK